MLMLTPCGEEAGAISVCVNAKPLYVCVHEDSNVSCVCVCVCGGVRQRGGWDTMKWVAERAPPTIKALNGQPEVPVSV